MDAEIESSLIIYLGCCDNIQFYIHQIVFNVDVDSLTAICRQIYSKLIENKKLPKGQGILIYNIFEESKQVVPAFIDNIRDKNKILQGPYLIEKFNNFANIHRNIGDKISVFRLTQELGTEKFINLHIEIFDLMLDSKVIGLLGALSINNKEMINLLRITSTKKIS
jgi:hypothetical protein